VHVLLYVWTGPAVIALEHDLWQTLWLGEEERMGIASEVASKFRFCCSCASEGGSRKSSLWRI